jgi:single-strand DNA-binding protein
MKGINNVILVGHLGKDPDIREFDSGNIVANFPMATTERFKTKDGKTSEKTDWHNVVCWGKLAELADKFLQKGSLVYLSGRSQTRSWDDTDGKKRYITEVNGRELVLLDRKPDSLGAPPKKEAPAAEVVEEPVDDLPY